MNMSGQYLAPSTLPPGKNHTTHSTGGWVHLEQIWTFREEKILLPLLGLEARTAPFYVCRAVLTNIRKMWQ
jgi:hypothetical protein